MPPIAMIADADILYIVYSRLNIDQFAHFDSDSLVEIEQIIPPFFIERADIVLIILKELILP